MEPQTPQFTHHVRPERVEGGKVYAGKTIVLQDHEGNLVGHLMDRTKMNDTSVAAVVEPTKEPHHIYKALREAAAKEGIPTDNVIDRYDAYTPTNQRLR